MLVQYTAMLFFPGGGQAIGASIGVSVDGSNQAPMMYADALGAVPEANPMVGDATGTITFYASPGLYLAELAGTWTRIPIDPSYPDPVFPNLYVHTQAVASDVWTINHFFGVNPSVTLVGGALQSEETEVSFPSPTQTVLTFSSAQTGTAYLRK